MQKIILFLILFSLIPLCNGITVLDNALIGEDKEYFSTNVDSFYSLNVSDVLTQLQIKYEVNKYPQTIIYNFYSINNQTITLKNVITKKNMFPIGFEIIETYTLYKNNKPLNFSSRKQDTNMFNVSSSFLISFDKFKNKQTIYFSGDQFSCLVGWIGYPKSVDYNERGGFFVNKFSLTNQTSFLAYSELKLEYTDKILEINKYSIDSRYDSLNFIFKFMFQIGKVIVGVSNLIGIISTTDFLNFQSALLLPLEILNIILNTILMILAFIVKMGILFFLSMIILLSFIFSVITSKNILEAIPKFVNTTIYILTLLIINPVKWIFEKIVKFWSH